MMKKIFRPCFSVILSASTLNITCQMFAQRVEVTKTTMTSSFGIVNEFGLEQIIQTESSPEPLHFFSKTTTYVDEYGVSNSAKMVKTGLPVTVHYTKVRNMLMADKVVVRKATAVPVVIEENEITSTTTNK